VPVDGDAHVPECVDGLGLHLLRADERSRSAIRRPGERSAVRRLRGLHVSRGAADLHHPVGLDADYNLSLSGGALLGNVKLAYKVAAGSDATEFSSDQPNSSFVGIIHGYDNTKTSGPLQTHTRNVITSSLNYTATGITTDQAHELLIWVAWNDQSGATFTPPDGMTERVDTANAFATADLLNQAAAGVEPLLSSE
jgi:hypothetical protein